MRREKEKMSDPVDAEPECAARVMDEPRPPRPPRKRKEESQPSRLKKEAVEPVSEPVDPVFFVGLNDTMKKMVQQERRHRMSSLKVA